MIFEEPYFLSLDCGKITFPTPFDVVDILVLIIFFKRLNNLKSWENSTKTGTLMNELEQNICDLLFN